MRIAIFSDTFLPQTNGVANVVYHSAKNLAERGHQVWVFTVSGDYKKNNDDEKITIVILPSIGAGVYQGERFTLPIGLALNRLRKFNPDVIHSHTPLSVGWEAILGAKLLRTGLVGTHHTFYDHYLKHLKADYDWAKKLSWKYTLAYYNCCDLILSPSQSLADALQEKGIKKPIEVLKNSIRTDFFVPVKDLATKTRLKKEFGINSKSLVYMGRISYEKSIDQLIRAFALASSKNPQIELVIIGDGPERKSLESLTKNLGVEDKIIFTGTLRGEELVRGLQANDIFITASKTENMPLSVLEAMSAGLPIIAVSEKGLKEIVNNKINGFLVPADDTEAMAKKIIELISDDNLLKQFSAASRATAEAEYSPESISSSLEKHYQKIIKK